MFSGIISFKNPVEKFPKKYKITRVPDILENWFFKLEVFTARFDASLTCRLTWSKSFDLVLENGDEDYLI